MHTYCVYILEYPEEGYCFIEAESEEAAKLKYHEDTIGLDDPDRPELAFWDCCQDCGMPFEQQGDLKMIEDFCECEAEAQQQRDIKLLGKIREAATRYPRCCTQWQDSMGGMHCRDCAQKTFAMMYEIQQLLGVGKNCEEAK